VDERLPVSWLVEAIRNDNCAFLCGAGVSVPSKLPDAASFVAWLVDCLVDACASAGAELTDAAMTRLRQERLEWVLGVAGRTPGVSPADALAPLDGANPSGIHGFVAECAGRFGTRPGVVLTTNFDCCLEDAFGVCGRPAPRVLAAPNLDGDLASGDDVVVAKVHGSLRGPAGRRAVSATLDAIGQYFSRPAEARLNQLLKTRSLVVLGYSGNDHHDVMPYLWQRMHPEPLRIIWVQHDGALSGDHVLRIEPPQELRLLVGDRYVRANTTAVVRRAAESLGIAPLLEPAAGGPAWRAGVREWVWSLGPRSLLVLGDLAMNADDHDCALSLYSAQSTGCPDLRTSSRESRRAGTLPPCYPWRATGTKRLTCWEGYLRRRRG
jgi:hypothetical protein